MDVEPPDDALINDIYLSGDECIVLECNLSVSGEECKECDLLGEDCRDCVLDASNISPIMGKPHNNFATILAAEAKIAFEALVSLEESVTHHLDEISLTAEQQVENRKVQSHSYRVRRSTNPHQYLGVFMSTFQKRVQGPGKCKQKKSAIARDSICGATLCPSRPFRLFGAIRLIFCVDHVLFRNKHPIVTACRVICIIFRANNKITNIVIPTKWMNTTRRKRKIMLFSLQSTLLC
jgi:hypothetical protein